MADNLTPIQQSPRQASQIFGLGGSRAPRPKNLFAVNFRKSGSSTEGSNSSTTQSFWNKDLGFIVKSVDRPSIEPKVEELNQYNKKRLVHTGYKIGAVRMVIYDTADSLVMRMWAEYAKKFFGDFRHQDDSGVKDFGYDVMTKEFKDSAGQGFGFAPQAETGASAAAMEFSSHFFFDSISVYQVFGKKFVQFDLINPKIVSFDPDDLDFSNSEIATYTLTIQSEAVIYKNDFQPTPIEQDAFLQQAFSDVAYYEGKSLDVSSGAETNTLQSQSFVSPQAQALPFYESQFAPATPTVRSYANSAGTGTLNAYGDYSFGTTITPDLMQTSAAEPSTSRSLTADLTQAVLVNPAIATALALSVPPRAGEDMALQTMLQPYAQPATISQATYDAARAAVGAAGSNFGRVPENYAEAIIYGVIASGELSDTTAREQVYNKVPPHTPHANSWNSATGRGLALTRDAYGVLNAQRPASSQIGFNERQRPARLGQMPPDFTRPR